MSTKFPAPSHPSSNSMTLVSDDPSYWPLINAWRISSYFVVAVGVGVVYDWALTFGQEVELVWVSTVPRQKNNIDLRQRQRWSLMTVLYLSVRYLGFFYIVINILVFVFSHQWHTGSVPTILLTDAGCRIVYLIYGWTDVVVFPMLCVILITRLHAMYQRSTRILIFLVVVSLPINIFDVVANAIVTRHDSGGTLNYNFSLVNSISWILSAVWEVLAMCLAVWIAVKHFRELRQHSAGGIIGDCFTELIKSHVFYFASFAAVSCFGLVINLSPTILANPFSLETQIVIGVAQILQVIQCYVLGPRLILSLREYHARLVADSDAATGMTSIAFLERVQISTGSGV
ncbi:hypothetical protein DEU56DRAFT_942325 [Suillus clintonianus]|uniref:uncharacterized protein n=1 Tax=Suillus clintonianus TaxID=1904413 RepID=UPI001B85C391|nr:uncharacterized protein DEU56DRAFT_942325 [Suillus clintonianus]KAG2139679.1 hypothetical protein DEU56DRAFT_942325 [Suillus clintonianus]